MSAANSILLAIGIYAAQAIASALCLVSFERALECTRFRG
jgi:hypothetical protein